MVSIAWGPGGCRMCCPAAHACASHACMPHCRLRTVQAFACNPPAAACEGNSSTPTAAPLMLRPWLLYRRWESNGYFKPDPEAAGEPYVISMPPPNVTGKLHMGHAMFATLQVRGGCSGCGALSCSDIEGQRGCCRASREWEAQPHPRLHCSWGTVALPALQPRTSPAEPAVSAVPRRTSWHGTSACVAAPRCGCPVPTTPASPRRWGQGANRNSVPQLLGLCIAGLVQECAGAGQSAVQSHAGARTADNLRCCHPTILPVRCRWWWRNSWRRRGGTGERWGGRPLRQRCGWEGEGGQHCMGRVAAQGFFQSVCSDVFSRSLACHQTLPASLKANAI